MAQRQDSMPRGNVFKQKYLDESNNGEMDDEGSSSHEESRFGPWSSALKVKYFDGRVKAGDVDKEAVSVTEDSSVSSENLDGSYRLLEPRHAKSLSTRTQPPPSLLETNCSRPGRAGVRRKSAGSCTSGLRTEQSLDRSFERSTPPQPHLQDSNFRRALKGRRDGERGRRSSSETPKRRMTFSGQENFCAGESNLSNSPASLLLAKGTPSPSNSPNPRKVKNSKKAASIPSSTDSPKQKNRLKKTVMALSPPLSPRNKSPELATTEKSTSPKASKSSESNAISLSSSLHVSGNKKGTRSKDPLSVSDHSSLSRWMHVSGHKKAAMSRSKDPLSVSDHSSFSRPLHVAGKKKTARSKYLLSVSDHSSFSKPQDVDGNKHAARSKDPLSVSDHSSFSRQLHVDGNKKAARSKDPLSVSDHSSVKKCAESKAKNGPTSKRNNSRKEARSIDPLSVSDQASTKKDSKVSPYLSASFVFESSNVEARNKKSTIAATQRVSALNEPDNSFRTRAIDEYYRILKETNDSTHTERASSNSMHKRISTKPVNFERSTSSPVITSKKVAKGKDLCKETKNQKCSVKDMQNEKMSLSAHFLHSSLSAIDSYYTILEETDDSSRAPADERRGAVVPWGK
ncbi:hypothetical protein ACA910_015846 [Epithemia clementina (nom. ined.)]